MKLQSNKIILRRSPQVKLLLALVLLMMSGSVFGQRQLVEIHFNLLFNGQVFELEKSYPFESDSIQFENLKFHISDVELYQDSERISKMEKQHCLIDVQKPESAGLSMPINPTAKSDDYRIDRIKFKLGIDSLTNVSGAMGGDLDPMHGMYWAWQSGYINFKLEGNTEECPARNHLFQFHLGGYMPPFYGLQTIELPIQTSAKIINVNVEIAHFLEGIDLKTQYEVMRPCEEAVELAAKAKQIFSIGE